MLPLGFFHMAATSEMSALSKLIRQNIRMSFGTFNDAVQFGRMNSGQPAQDSFIPSSPSE